MPGQPDSADHPLTHISVRDDGILAFRYRPGIYIQLDDARSFVRAGLDLVGDRAPMPCIVYVGDVRGMTREAREYLARSDENRRLCVRVALVVTTRIGRMLVNLLFALSPPRIPTRAFTDDAAALDWLRNPHDRRARSFIQDSELEP